MWNVFSASLWLCGASFAVAQSSCGVKGPDDTPWTRIVNGQDATACEYTWQISMRYHGSHYCGGSILSKDWILTAAHCVGGASRDQIVVGDYNKGTNSDEHQAEYDIDEIISHPSYSSRTMKYDFALIKLKSPIEFNSCVGPVCLPAADATADAKCFISGWGTLYSGGNSPDKLQEAEVTVMSNSKCTNEYGYSSSEIHDSMLCASGYNSDGYVDACQGDSGGPLACEESPGKWVLHGVTSWGYGCAQASYPGVYSRVWEVMDWINDAMNKEECVAANGGSHDRWCQRKCNKATSDRCHRGCSKKCSSSCACVNRRLAEDSGSNGTVFV